MNGKMYVEDACHKSIKRYKLVVSVGFADSSICTDHEQGLEEGGVQADMRHLMLLKCYPPDTP